jgi:hypothetical protein
MTSPKDPANLGRKDWLIKLEKYNVRGNIQS